MIEIQRILCPIDFSDFSRRALAHAVAIAKWYQCTITLFHVAPVVPVAAYAPGSTVLPSAALGPDDRDALLAAMKQFAESEAGAGVPFHFDLAEGAIVGQILAKTEVMPADLVVMGTHGRSGFERLMLGSVTEKVLHKAACPVLTVPRAGVDVVPAPSVLFKKIVCAIDFSDCSMHALNYAFSLAQEADANLTIVHAIELPPDVFRDVPENAFAGPRSLREYTALAEEDSRKRLEAAVPESVRAYCTVETAMPVGKPSHEILRIAEERKADLLVIGVHGRGVVDRMLFGSTAHHLVRQASCPVLTLRKG
jgi:nucleotide-binding universal stress UspA family protein